MSTSPPPSVGPTFIVRPTFDQAFDQRIADFADRHGHAAGHAAFAGAAEGGGLNGFDGLTRDRRRA